jgi:hypothetical protein
MVKEAVEGKLVLGCKICRDQVGGLPSLLHEDEPRQFLLPKRQGQNHFFCVLWIP